MNPEHIFFVDVSYVTTVNTGAGVVAHFFRELKRGRLMLLVDHPAGQVDTPTALRRCMEVSKIEVFSIGEGLLHLLDQPKNMYEEMMEQFEFVDFVRMLGGVFRPGDTDIPVFEMTEGQLIDRRVVCRLGSLEPGAALAGTPSIEDPLGRLGDHTSAVLAAPSSPGNRLAATGVSVASSGGGNGLGQYGASVYVRPYSPQASRRSQVHFRGAE